MKKLLLFTTLFFSAVSFARTAGTYPAEVEVNLKKAGKNRAELENAIMYFKKSKDPLKIKALYFLIANMDIHYSADYYWVDQKGKTVPFNELAYPDFEKAKAAFEELKKKTPGIHPKTVQYPDLAAIKASFLIENINLAFDAWKNGYAKNIPLDDFCEYILPYRVSVEPLQNWRATYRKKFQWITTLANKDGLMKALSYTAADTKNWFKSTGDAARTEPIPRLSALQLLLRKAGVCEDMADLGVFSLRSQGLPIALEDVPYWATSANSHFFNTIFDNNMHPIKFDLARTPPEDNQLSREPSKVIQETFSKQKGVLADIEDVKNIPSSFMQNRNYKDVTSLYWKTTTVDCELFPATEHPKVAYAYIFNNMHWKPAWWGKVNNGHVQFSNMSKGVVYLPTYYMNGKAKIAGYPIAEGYNHEQVLRPDIGHRAIILINEEDRYLRFQSGKRYNLYYWDQNWKLCGVKIAMPSARSMSFENVPKNALLLLKPEYSTGKERPFMVTEEGKIVWW